jgi:hypothetical protein
LLGKYSSLNLKRGKKLIMDARARENEITGVRTMYKTDRSLMNLGARDYSTFIKGPFITCVKYII